MRVHSRKLWRGTSRERRGLITLFAAVLTISGALVGSLFIRAPYSPSVWRGHQIANRAGCFACHGPNGLGGVPNPESVEGTIPPLVAEGAFTFYVRSEEELREWIVYGRPLHRSSSERFRQQGIIEM